MAEEFVDIQTDRYTDSSSLGLYIRYNCYGITFHLGPRVTVFHRCRHLDRKQSVGQQICMCGAAWEPRSKAHPVCRSLQPGVRDTNKLPLPESSTAKVYNPLNKDNNNPLNSPGCYPRETVQICYMSRTPGSCKSTPVDTNIQNYYY